LAEDLCKTVEDEIGQLNDFSQSLIEKIQEEREKPKQAVKEVTSKINKFQEQINKHFEHQMAENDKFQKEITDLKGDKTSIEQALIGTFS
jgi:predicted  nucleic acid-binding Zn-ribbon protein